MDLTRKQWNEAQQRLKHSLKQREDHAQALELFLQQHAAIHSAMAVPGPGWSFEDEVWQDLSDDQARCIPPGSEHSIGWLVWHVTRCEDITFNLLVAGAPQVLTSGGWLQKTGAPWPDTGNSHTPQQVAQLSQGLDIGALRQYRAAVAQRTREIVAALPVGDFMRAIQPDRLQRVLDEGAVTSEAGGIVAYWGAHRVAGLLLMPGTRHPFIHWNESLRIKRKLHKGG